MLHVEHFGVDGWYGRTGAVGGASHGGRVRVSNALARRAPRATIHAVHDPVSAEPLQRQEAANRFLRVAGGMLLVLGAVPAHDAQGSIVTLPQLPGTSIATALPVIYPLLLGVLYLAVSSLRFDPAIRYGWAFVFALLPVALSGANPVVQLGFVGLWEPSATHGALLFGGAVFAGLACRMALDGRPGRSFIAVSAALMLLGYALVPDSEGVPPAVVVAREWVGVSASGNGARAVTALRAAFLTGVVALGGLVVWAVAVRKPRGDTERVALLVAWVAAGILPAFALPLAVRSGLANESVGALVASLRAVAVLAVEGAAAPVAIALAMDAWAVDAPPSRA